MSRAGRAGRLSDYATTIFAEMSELAIVTGSVNLGQGFPDTDGAQEIKEVAIEAIRRGDNQYPPGAGVAELRSAISDHQAACYGLRYDPDGEVLVTVGATEGIAASILALCEPGDEVVMFEPYYDSYPACVAMAGARRRVVPLRPPQWSFDLEELERAITDRTRLLLFNSPHNPTGKVFDRSELEALAALCREHDLIAVTDEVYEHLVFDGEHVPLATLPGMRERTVTVSSAGKTFGFTGWKVGWACAPPDLLTAVRTAKQFLTYVSGGPFQYAVAMALAAGRRYIDPLVNDLRQQRQLLCRGLEELGMPVYWPAASYFATTDVGPLGYEDADEFCRMLPRRHKVVAIPGTAFYDDKAASATLVRWAFCKRPAVLEEALERLGPLAP